MVDESKYAGLLAQLSKANSATEQSAIVANLAFDQLSPHVANVARHCIVLRWFDEIIVESISRMLGNYDTFFETKASIYQMLTDLRFVDSLGNRAVFHSQTRQGLLEYYKNTDPDFLIKSAHTAAMIYLTHPDQPSAEIEALFCYTASGQEENALEILDKLLIQNSEVNNWRKILVLFDTLTDAASLSLAKPLPLTESHYFIRGIAFDQLKDYENALNDYNRVIELDPTNIYIYLHKGRVYRELLAFPQALNNFDQAVAINSKSEAALIGRGNTYFEINELHKAIKDYTSAIWLNWRSILLLYIWIAKVGKKIWNELFLHTSIEPFYYRGSAYMELRQWQKAIADFNRILFIDANHVETYNSRGIAYKKLNLLEMAIQDFDRAITLAPDQPRGYLNRGGVKKWQKDLTGAIKDFDRVLELDPDNAVINIARGRLRKQLGDRDLARLDYLRAKDIDEDIFDEFRSSGKVTFRDKVDVTGIIATQIIPKLNDRRLTKLKDSLPYFISLSNRRYYLYESNMLVGRTFRNIEMNLDNKEFINLERESEAQTVSRNHAEIKLEGDTWYIMHLSENSSSFVNTTQLTSSKPKSLKNGDFVYLGKVQLMFCLPAPDSQ